MLNYLKNNVSSSTHSRLVKSNALLVITHVPDCVDGDLDFDIIIQVAGSKNLIEIP